MYLQYQWKREVNEVGLTGPRYRQPRAGLGLATFCAAEKYSSSQSEQGNQVNQSQMSMTATI